MTLVHSRSVLTGLSMLGSIAAFGAVVSLAYQNAADRLDAGATPLVRVPALPAKLKPDVLLEDLSPIERAQRGLDRLLPEAGDGNATGVDEASARFEPRPGEPPVLPSAPVEPAPADGRPAIRTPAPPASLPSAARGPAGYQVQLLAASGEAAAERAWAGLRTRFAAVLAGYRASIEPATVAAGTVYRVRIGPFETRAAAQATCAELERQGAGCFVLRV
jgi:cell division septation protein DedD